MNENAAAIVEALGLQPHPEGGWYRETWRADAAGGERAAGTAIHFLLAAGERSHWHRVDAAEIWLWHGGDPLTLQMAQDEAGPIRAVTLGGNVPRGEAPQCVIPAGDWQAAEPLAGDAGYVLVSCIVVPGFEFAGFTLADSGWAPGQA
ncbi:cupin domain-containing protein [Parasphingopyxis marina]|uniref:Cupin domain-containing protein n=1 Tax=Parasphingopyxis marina TaxID=2761622 RepID=A0A842HW42_9SPHN|nr:cupin domain-containing protein [Parasphingopyxis marina]MBC2776489.1 cupin domain-containing protein [Parasphingopyxis marina]